MIEEKREIEQIKIESGEEKMKEEMMKRYEEMIYYGLWLQKEREMMKEEIDKRKRNVEGEVKIKI